MDVRKYAVLLQALDSGNFSKAAEKLSYTQSGISHMMKNLEDTFGFPVLIRKHSGVTLTKSGEEILPYIRALVKASSALSEKVSSLNGFKGGQVSVGTFSSFCIRFLVPVLRSFHTAYPAIQLTFFHETSVELEKMLQENRLDLAFCCDYRNAGFNKQFMYEDPMLVILPAGHPCAGWKSFPQEAFEGEPFIVPSSTGNCESSQFIKEKGIRVNRLIHALNTASAIAMVEGGLGISLISQLSLETFPYKVAAIPLDPPHNSRIYMLSNKSPALSPASNKFAEYCMEIIPGLAAG